MSSSRQSQLLLNHNSTPQSQKEAGAPLTNSFDGKHRANTARPSPTPWRVCSRLCVFNKHSLTSGKIVTGPLHGWSRPPCVSVPVKGAPRRHTDTGPYQDLGVYILGELRAPPPPAQSYFRRALTIRRAALRRSVVPPPRRHPHHWCPPPHSPRCAPAGSRCPWPRLAPRATASRKGKSKEETRTLLSSVSLKKLLQTYARNRDSWWRRKFRNVRLL